MGLVYSKPESKLKKQDLKVFLKSIEEKALYAQQNGNLFVVIGDFNAYIGDSIRGNHEKVSHAGTKLLKLVKRQNLQIVNCLNICNGKWSRISTTDKNNDDKKSILDYVLANTHATNTIQKMCIDESRQYCLSHLKKEGKFSKLKLQESDHNAFIINFKLKRPIGSSSTGNFFFFFFFYSYKILQ